MDLDLTKWETKKTTKMTEQKAIAKAMERLKTFESNLERHDTKTHYVFKKIRG